MSSLKPDVIGGINVTGHTLYGGSLDFLEYRDPDGNRYPITGLVVMPWQTIEQALRSELAKLPGWSIWFVPPADAS